jgi:hypothetical protein
MRTQVLCLAEKRDAIDGHDRIATIRHLIYRSCFAYVVLPLFTVKYREKVTEVQSTAVRNFEDDLPIP